MNVVWKILVTPKLTVRTLLVVTCAVVKQDTVEMAIAVKVATLIDTQLQFITLSFTYW